MHVAHASHTWFIFNLNTESHHLQIIYTIFTCYFNGSFDPAPCLALPPCLLTWRAKFFARDGKYLSTLVPGLPTTAPPFASPLTFSHPTGYTIYIDDISNSSRPRLAQYSNRFCFYTFEIKHYNLSCVKKIPFVKVETDLTLCKNTNIQN
jgi:hypothetical protein